MARRSNLDLIKDYFPLGEWKWLNFAQYWSGWIPGPPGTPNRVMKIYRVPRTGVSELERVLWTIECGTITVAAHNLHDVCAAARKALYG